MKDKLNPEFIGVAHKLSSFKHKRKLIERKQKQIKIVRRFIYSILKSIKKEVSPFDMLILNYIHL